MVVVLVCINFCICSDNISEWCAVHSCVVTPSTFPLQWQSADGDRSGSSAWEHPVPDPRDTGESDHRVLSWRQLRLLYTVPWLSRQTGKNSYTCKQVYYYSNTCKQVYIVLPQSQLKLFYITSTGPSVCWNANLCHNLAG